jgi:hypothetical protein
MSRRASPTIVAAMLLAILVPISLMAETVCNRDNQSKEQWLKEWISESRDAYFSFDYDGRQDAKTLETCSRTATTL